jgi:cell volume regulation protein A
MIDISGENVVLVGALLLFVAVMAGKVAYRFGAPALLLFLGVGMLFGLNFISYRSVEMTQFVGMIALCIILFTGGMDTKFSEIKPIIGPGVVLATVGVVMTAFVLAGFVWLVASSAKGTFATARPRIWGPVANADEPAFMYR